MARPPLQLSPTLVAAHLACAHLTQLRRAEHAGLLPHGAFRVDPRAEALRARGEEHERQHVAALQRAGLRVVDLRGEGDPAATIEAMRAGADAIVQAPL